MAGNSQAKGSDSNKNFAVPLVILTTLFFMWGFITCLNDILIPFLKDEFSLSNLQANLVQSAFFGAYFIVSLLYFIFSVYVFDPIQRIGYKNAIITGLVIAAIGCILFVPASDSGSFMFFLFALFVLASGVTILQMGANPYVTLLGKPETASSRLNMTQAFNALGTTVAPVVGGLLIFGARSSDAVQGPYIGLTVALIILGVFILFSPLPKISEEEKEESPEKQTKKKGKGALAYPHLILGVLCIFAYVGGEVSIGSNLITYLEEVCSMPKESADSFLAIFWGGAMIGRFYGSIFLTGKKFELSKLPNIAIILLFSFVLGIFLVNKSYIVDSVVGKRQDKIVGMHSDSLSISMNGQAIYNAETQIPQPIGNEHVSDIVAGSFSSFELLDTEDGKKKLELFASPEGEAKDFQVYANLKNNEVTLSAFESVSFSFAKLSFWEAGIFCLMALLNIGAFFLGAFSPGRTLALFAGIVVFLLTIAVLASGTFAMWSILSIGLFNSIMFPTIFSLAIKGLGRDTSQGSSLLVMAIVGGGVVPPLQGLVADLVNIQISFLIPIVCYIYILFYGLIGSKPKNIESVIDGDSLASSPSSQNIKTAATN